MRTLTTKEYELISQIYNSTDEIEASLSFEFGIQNDLYIHSFIHTRKQNEDILFSRLLQYDQRKVFTKCHI